MQRDAIAREIRRLAPWYYDYDLQGVSTTIIPPFDHHGHRKVDVAAISKELWAGKRILDVGCNEGGWTFSALQHGAAHIDAFDVRDINIEKARFVAKVKQFDRVSFSVESCDTWLAKHPQETYDYVFLCGLLYHLPDPWRTIQEYAARATQGVLVSTLLGGGPDGWTPFPEIETIGASEDPSVLSMTPNTVNTVILEFEKWGLHPRYYWESRYGDYWGTCNIWLERWTGVPGAVRWSHLGRTGRRVAIHLFPLSLTRDEGDGAWRLLFEISLFNEMQEALNVDAHLFIGDAPNAPLVEHGPERLALPARAKKGEGNREALVRRQEIALPGVTKHRFVSLELRNASTGEPLDRTTLRVPIP